MKCKLIGIDSSTAKTGVSVFINGVYKNCHLIDTSSIKDAGQRFDTMCKNMLDLLSAEKPDIVVIERMHTQRNADSFRKLCKIMGAVQGWCISHGCEYTELSPSEWRRWINTEQEKLPRDRKSLKLWSINKAKKNHNIVVSDDAADAICIGEAYINLCNSYTRRKEYGKQEYDCN